MAIELYQETGTGGRMTGSWASIRANRSWTISKGAMIEFGLHDWEAVILGYDNERNEIVIQQADPSTVGSRKLQSANKTGQIRCNRFFTHFGITLDPARRKYPVTMRDGVIYIGLNPIPAATAVEPPALPVE